MKNAHKAMALTIATTMSAGMGLHFPSPVPYNPNPARSQGAREFNRKKQRRKTADISKRTNRRKRR